MSFKAGPARTAIGITILLYTTFQPTLPLSDGSRVALIQRCELAQNLVYIDTVPNAITLLEREKKWCSTHVHRSRWYTLLRAIMALWLFGTAVGGMLIPPFFPN